MNCQFKTVAELLEDPARWTAGISAADDNGRAVEHDSLRAVCWCIYGAMRHVYGQRKGFESAREKIQMFQIDYIGFNDTHTHAEVLQLCRKAGI